MFNYSTRLTEAENSVIAIIICILIGGFLLFINLNTEKNVTIKISSKKNIEGRYLIYTKEETFKCTDSFFDLKFTSSDMYSKFVRDSTYTVDVRGLRIPFLSMYRNIVKVK